MNEIEDAPDDFVNAISSVYLQNDTEMKPVIRAVLLSTPVHRCARRYQRYSWPVEFVVRALKETGYLGFSVNDALTPMTNMGQSVVRAAGRQRLGSRSRRGSRRAACSRG